MKNFTLKKTGRALLLLVFLFTLSPGLIALEIKAELEDNRIETGERTVLKISIPGEIGDIKPLKVPTVPGLVITYYGPSMMYQNINGREWKGVVLSYTVTGMKKGKYRIPPFVFDIKGNIVKTRDLALLVSGGAARPQGREDARGIADIQVTKKTVYVGEPVILRYYLLSRGIKSVKYNGTTGPPDNRGFVVKEFSETPDDEIVKQGSAELLRSHLVSYLLIPAESGNLSAGGGKIEVLYDIAGGYFGSMNSTNIDFETVKIRALPLPEEGKPADFRGDVGAFTIKAEYSPDPIGIFQEKKIRVTVTGRGNLVTMTIPAAERDNGDARIMIEEKEKKAEVRDNTVTGEKNFIFTVIPQRGGPVDLGKIMLSSFNPWTGKYERAESAAVRFQVTGANKDKGEAGEKIGDDKGKAFDVNPVFILLILLVLTGTALVFAWERKRLKRAVTGTGDADEKMEAREPESDLKDHLVGLKRLRDVNNPGEFMLRAEKALEGALKICREKNQTGGLPDTIKGLKERLYDFRYGGAKITAEDMGLIFQEITALGRKLGKL